MPSSSSDGDRIDIRSVNDILKQFWTRILVLGVGLTFLGILAVAKPYLFALSIEIFIAWLLIITGVLCLVTLATANVLSDRWQFLVFAIVSILLGLVLIAFPEEGVMSLTMVVVSYFIVQGFGYILTALSEAQSGRHRMWLFAAGLVDWILAGLVIAGWPGTNEWFIGLYVGISLMFGGLGLIVGAIGARAGAGD